MTVVLAAGIFLYENKIQEVSQTQDNFIKWVDFNASKEALKKACLMDIESYESDVHLDWITLLAYAAVRGGGEFNSKSTDYIDEVASKLTSGETTEAALNEKYQYFSYYYKAYSAVLGGMIGEYEIEDENGTYQKKYGLKAFSPIAAGFSYQDYDDDSDIIGLNQKVPFSKGDSDLVLLFWNLFKHALIQAADTAAISQHHSALQDSHNWTAIFF